MRSCVLGAGLLALLVPGARAQLDGMFLTTSTKKLDIPLPARTETFAIPDGQCSGFIGESADPQSLLCPQREGGGVRIAVKDYAPYPDVAIDSALRNATVTRAPNVRGRCDREAEVRVETYCVYGSSPAPAPAAPPPRRRRSAGWLPAGPPPAP